MKGQFLQTHVYCLIRDWMGSNSLLICLHKKCYILCRWLCLWVHSMLAKDCC